MSSFLLVLLGCTACAPPASQGGFDSPTPGAKLYALTEAAQSGDHSPETLMKIVEQLDSDDPAVRFMAIECLQQLNDGDRLGYDFTLSRVDRQAGISNWVNWVHQYTMPDVESAAPEGGADG